MSPTKTDAQTACERHLQEHVQSCREERILPSEVDVAERLLNRSDELAEVYGEVYAGLSRDGVAYKVLLASVVSAAAFWEPRRLEAARDDRQRLVALNAGIAESAAALADLLQQRDDLHNRTSFHSGTLYHPRDMIDQASRDNGHYRTFLRAPLEALSGRFDLKYWPSLAACVRSIGDDASAADVLAVDPLTAAGTRSKRPSKADFLRALREAIDESRGAWMGAIPPDFRLSDKSIATLVNVLLDLPVAELVDADYVKALRGRDRRAGTGK